MPDIRVTHVGTIDHHRTITWPEGWPVPRVDDEIRVPGMDEVTNVRVVEWLPEGDPEHPGEPFVYVVIGPRRR